MALTLMEYSSSISDESFPEVGRSMDFEKFIEKFIEDEPSDIYWSPPNEPLVFDQLSSVNFSNVDRFLRILCNTNCPLVVIQDVLLKRVCLVPNYKIYDTRDSDIVTTVAEYIASALLYISRLTPGIEVLIVSRGLNDTKWISKTEIDRDSEYSQEKYQGPLMHLGEKLDSLNLRITELHARFNLSTGTT